MRAVAGILGGMGPEATILLQQRLLSLVEAKDDADHLPLLIDMNPQVPSRIAHLIEGTGEDPGPELARMARRLEGAGTTVLAMPCNTAHHYAGAITAAVRIPFLNMVDLSADHMARQLNGRCGRVGILSSPALRQAAVFDRALSRHGLTPVWPRSPDGTLTAIRRIKSEGVTEPAVALVQAALRDLITQGADLICVACSEFSLLAASLPKDLPVIDTVDVLAAALYDTLRTGHP